MKSIIEKIENRLKELNNIKEGLEKTNSFKMNKAFDLSDTNARIDELNNLLND